MRKRRIREIIRCGQPGETLRLTGWIRTKRDAKTFSFLEITDGSSVANLQVVADESIPGYRENIAALTTGSSVTVEGTLAQSPAKGQRVELRAQSVTVHCRAPQDYPLQKKHHSFEYLREIAHLRPRTNSISAVLRIRNTRSYAVHRFFQERGFCYVHTPIITASDCEGAGKQFAVTTLDPATTPVAEGRADFSQDFFGKRAYLTVSGQLEGEICAMALSDVYTFGPTFRAENSNTARHLAEFWMIEPEMAFCDLSGDMDVAEEFVRFLVRAVLEDNGEEVEFFDSRIDQTLLTTLRSVVDQPFMRIPYTEAIAILEKANSEFEYKVSWGADIQSEHERYLVEKTFGKPVIVHDYPKEIKAFYMKINDDSRTVRAMDLLVPRIGELIGGSEREDRHDLLVSRIRDLGLNEKEYWWYLDLRKYGGTPHAGFGLGFERLLLLVTGMQNIRDVIPFPRYPGYAEF